MRNNLLNPDSTKKNFVFQFLYQVIILVIPLLVSPYLTRILGGNSLGIYSYTYSIAYYFVVVAMLGINMHGQRIISQRRNNLTELRKTFWSLFTVHIIASVLAFTAYILYVFMVCRSDKNVALAQTIYVSSAPFDLTWLFYGLEKFKTITIRNGIVKIVNTFCIFAFVKSPSDLILYTIIMAVTACVGQIILIPQVFSAISPIKFTKQNVIEHIKPLFTLFAAVVAATLYTVFDKTLLGLMMTKESVAYYEYSDKIINIPKTFISIIGTVLYPKACKYAQMRDFNGLHNNIKKSLTMASLIGFASCFGLLSISEQFALLYYGEEFAVCGEIIARMTPIILLIGIGDSVRSQYIFPLKMDIKMVKILFLNAGVNIILSALLIPSLGITGAVIGTIAAEMTGLIIELYLVREYVSVKWVFRQCFPFAIIGIIMYLIVKIFAIFAIVSWSSLVVQILIGAATYCAFSFIYMYCFRREFVVDGFDTLKNRFGRKNTK